jgi:hypothetical protein
MAVILQWPSGLKQEFGEIAGDAIYEIDEVSGLKKLTALSSDHE